MLTFILENVKFREIARVELDGEIIGLDTSGDISYISHAHSDHVHHPKKRRIIASDPTISIGGISFQEKLSPKNIQLFPAGHMFGATQIQIPFDGGILTYTGDISLQAGFTYPKAEIPETDVLIIESTYGHPDYTFPSKEDLAKTLLDEINVRLKYGNVVFGVYPRGKAQEVIKILNEGGITPLLSTDVLKPTEAYVKHGMKLDYVHTLSEEGQEMMSSNFVAIIPKVKVKGLLKRNLTRIYQRPVYFASVSGWNLKYDSGIYDVSLPMSDHADYYDLIEYVEYANPKKVYVFGPHAKELATDLKRKNYDAEPLEGGH